MFGRLAFLATGKPAPRDLALTGSLDETRADPAPSLSDDRDDASDQMSIDEAIAAGAAQVDQYKGGNEKVLGWFVGQVMKATQGKANPQVVNEMLRKKLDG